MGKPQITFTKFNAPGIAKSFGVEDGVLVKKPAPNFSAGTFETRSVSSIDELEGFVKILRPGDFLTAGVHKTLTRGQCGPGPADIHRKKEDFPFADGQPGLLIIDSDNINKLGLPDLNSLATAVEKLVMDADYVMSTSASSGVTYNGVVGPTKGVHTFLFVEDAASIPTVLETLHKRSVILGYAWPLITKDGKILIRSLVDTAMKTSNQPCFEGGAILGAGITQKREIVGTPAGDEVSFLTIAPLTPDEEHAYCATAKKLSAAVAAQAAQVRAAWRSARHEKMVAKGCSPKNADQILDAATSGNYPVLSSDYEIETDNYGVLTVREIIADKVKYHGATCHDPLDPGYGAGKAKIYSNNSGSPAIHSFAHGETTYILGEELFAIFSKPLIAQNGATDLSGAALDVVDRTDAGNVAVLEKLTNGGLRYVLERKCFIAWDDERWQLDHGSQIAHQQALRVSEDYKKYAQQYRSNAQQAHISEKERKHLEATAKSLENWSQQCRNKPRLDAMLGLAQRDMRFVIQASELDRDPFLLGVANGTVNLRTGLLQPNSRSDFVTKRCPVAFNPTATAPRWQVFILEVTSTGGVLILGVLNRKERRHLARYLQKALGYCLTGSTEEQVMFILIGNGSNGKNVLLDTFKSIGGDYVETIAPEVLMAAKFDNGADQASPSSRKLAGARAAISSESKEGQKLDVSVVKRHTGGGFITARGLHESPMTFEITHKLLLMTNPEPSVDHMDDATRGRLHMIPFDMKWNRPGTTNPDPNLPDAQKDLMEVLRKEQEGILLWLVQGAAAYMQDGLAPPNEVVARTQIYLDSQDSFKQWAECYEKCAPCDGATAGTLYDQYSQLCREEALPVQIASAASLGKKMKASGYENLKARDGMKYGLRKKKLVDDSPAPDMKAILAAWDDDKASGGGAAGQCVTV